MTTSERSANALSADLSAPGQFDYNGYPCREWNGRPSEYQAWARQALEDELERALPWTHVTALCGTRRCTTVSHLAARHAQRIAYPHQVCIYCGMPGFTKDHLLPVTVTGEAVRQFVAIVPACGECNSGIGDRVGYRVTERREEAHRHIRKKYRKVLSMPPWEQGDLLQLGPRLRRHVREGIALRQQVLHRLEWPFDPSYDVRAFQKTGIEDPIEMGLL